MATDKEEYPDEYEDSLEYLAEFVRGLELKCGVRLERSENAFGGTCMGRAVVQGLDRYGKVQVKCSRRGHDMYDQLWPHVRDADRMAHWATLDASGSHVATAPDVIKRWQEMESPNSQTFKYGKGGTVVSVNSAGVMTRLSDAMVQHLVSTFIQFHTNRGFTDAPFGTARAVLDLIAWGESGVPELSRIVTVPTLLPGGRVLTTAGYDKASGVFLAPAVPVKLPREVTQTNVSDALALIDNLLHDFPFVSESDYAHAIALMMLGFVRSVINGPTPLHWVNANESRTGKGKLVACLLAPAYGEVGSTAYDELETERKKAISTLLRKGAGAILFDNVRGLVKSTSLEMALTQQRWESRILGQTLDFEVPIFATWVLTSNNATPYRDIRGRTLLIDLNRKVEDPERFVPEDGWSLGDVPPEVWAMEHRSELSRACLVLVKWWVQCGSPSPVVAVPMGGFEDWARVIGGVLENGGVTGFLGNVVKFDASENDERDELGEIFRTLAEHYGAEGATAKTIYVDGHISSYWATTSAKGMGMKLKHHKGRIAGGLQLAQIVTREANRWKVVGAS